MIEIPNYYKGHLLYGGHAKEFTNAQELRGIIDFVKKCNSSIYYARRAAFIQSPDRYLYSVSTKDNHINKTPVVLRLRTRLNPHLSLEDVRKDSRVYYDYARAVDKKRHVIMGQTLDGGKPDWLLEYELEELFS